MDGYLEFKYTDGREKKFGPGQFQHWGKILDLERVMRMLDYDNEVERTWKVEIAHYIRRRRDYEEELERKYEERRKEKEKEFAELDARAEELRARGLCKVKFNPYVVEYMKGSIPVKIRMEHLKYYPKAKLEEAIRELSGSILHEEITAMEEIINAMEEQKDHG